MQTQMLYTKQDCFSQYILDLISCEVTGDGYWYLMHKIHSGGWPYISTQKVETP